MRSNTFLLLVALLVISPLAADELYGTGYEPLSYFEAQSWINHTDVDAVIDLVILYDFVEHATPVVLFPQRSVVVAEDEIIMTPRGAIVVRIGHFWWAVTPPVEVAIFDPVKPVVPAWAWGVSGMAIGAAAALIIRSMIK